MSANPRVEIYDHYYKVVHTALESLGLQPTLLSTTLIDHLSTSSTATGIASIWRP